MIDPTKTTPEKLAEMNDGLIVDNNHLRSELNQWKSVFGHLGTADECGNEWIALKDKIDAQAVEIIELRKSAGKCYFDGVPVEGGAPRGTLHNPDGSRSIFDDVDQ